MHKGATDVDQYVVVYNPLAWNITTFVTVSVSSEAMSVYDELGRSVPAQVLQLCFFLLRFSHLSVFIDWILPPVKVGFSYLSFKGCFYLPVFSTERLFYCAKGPAALIVCLVCPLHVCCVWPGASYLIFLSLKTLFQINPFMLKPCLTIDSPVCTIGGLPWGGRRRESRNVGLRNWCQSAAIWQLILS